MTSFNETLKIYGANPDSDNLYRFDDDSASLLQYASLVNARSEGKETNDLHPLIAVYEWQERPLIYLADGKAIRDDNHFSYIRRVIALRGDAPYLGIVDLGQLTIHRISLDDEKKRQSTVDLKLVTPDELATTFPKLVNERPKAIKVKNIWIADLVLDLLKDAIDDLINHFHVAPEDAISLAGRALFARFLADRSLMDSSLDPASCFDENNKIFQTSLWLDKTFNGDFLPLSKDIIRSLSSDACKTLGNIARRAKHGQLYLDWENSWDSLDFAHIPIGVLSQAYEQYMRDHDNDTQKKQGSFYTPHFIVDLMVKGAFHALQADGVAHKAKVLDPAAGAGIFLVSTFQQLVRENWLESGERPGTEKLREILYNQITGFDINEGALRFASLGLYLISIELDPNPYPVEKLKFEHNLRGKVLYRFSQESGAPSAGSLGEEVGREHFNTYDLVIGNPPWTTNTKNPCWPEINSIVSQIAKGRLGDNTPEGLLPRNCLDLPFVWRAMEWAKVEGQIAFALSARVLFQQGTTMPEARQALFDALDISGVLNGSDLRMTKVWPHVDSPFCLLFAKNRLPNIHSSGFKFVSPRLEQSLNDSGVLRVDASNSERLNNLQLLEHPALLKILYRGSSLDLEIIQRIAKKKITPLNEYWKGLFGETRGYLNNTGQGYGKVNNATKVPQYSGGMIGMPELSKEEANSILVNQNNLPSFNLEYLHRLGAESIYKAPMLVLHKAPSASKGRISVTASFNDLVYSEIFYGYSTVGYADCNLLVKYLVLIIGSKFSLWYLLLTSGEFGYEREVVEKKLIQQIPIIPLSELNTKAKDQIDSLFGQLTKDNSEKNWLKVDAWIASIYGLNPRLLQVIDDTLHYNLPFSKNKKAAQAAPDELQISSFCEELNTELSPWMKKLKTEIQILPIGDITIDAPWVVLGIQPSEMGQENFHWAEILRISNEIGTTEVFIPNQSGKGLYVARLKQGRYWSRSQARLLARRIIWEHSDAILGQSEAA